MKSEKDDMQLDTPKENQKNRAENPASNDEQTSRFESSANRGKNEKEEKNNPRTNNPRQNSGDKPAELSPELTAEFTKHRLQISPPDADQPLPARMLNEFVYCPRLFYYEHVEGVFLHNADTLRGSALHKRVDTGKGALPPADGKDDSKPETIHSRSVTLGSKKLNVIAKMDFIEVRTVPPVGQAGDLFALEVTPVDYKAGAPREGQDQNEIWDADKMQLGVQILILREHGYLCREGIIYYCATRQRVRRPFTSEWEQWILKNIAAARQCCAGPIPPPLDHSPKCVRCSLAPVCLPDETRYLMPADDKTATAPETDSASSSNGKVRRLIAARDEERALYLNAQGLKIGRKSETLQIKEHGKLIDDVRLNDVNHVALFGNIQITTQAVQSLCYADIPIAYFSVGGRFYGLTRGHHQKNVFLRIQQFRTSAQPHACLQLARKFVEGKIRNHRTLLRRNHVEPPAEALSHLKQSAESTRNADNMKTLLGIEGAAAATYFKHFDGMIKPQELPLAEESDTSPEDFPFHFKERNRRPPTDPVNALLSLAYSLLSKDCAIAAYTVGFDPYVGFFHQPRFGRPALALDLMEEFRPLIAESVVITAINNRVIYPKDFVRAGNAVNLTPAGRKKFIQTYEQRMKHLLTHPVFQYKICYRRAIELQARLLARVLEEQIPDYKPLTTR